MDTNKSLTKTQDLQALLSNENEKRDVINRYIEQNLTPDVDFGSIEVRGKKSKPSLFKPGSEKMCSLFHLTPKFTKDTDTWEMLGSKAGTIAYICELIDQNGKVVGEGRGVAVTGSGQDFDVNKQVKIAEKRAQIDAVLRAFSLSERFTQDIEDMPPQEEGKMPSQNTDTKRLATDKQVNKITYDISYLQKLGYEDLLPMIFKFYKVESLHDLTINQASSLIDRLAEMQRPEVVAKYRENKAKAHSDKIRDFNENVNPEEVAVD